MVWNQPVVEDSTQFNDITVHVYSKRKLNILHNICIVLMQRSNWKAINQEFQNIKVEIYHQEVVDVKATPIPRDTNINNI